jgi:CheY-like chemotaxis protein
MISADPDIHVVAEAGTGAEALAVIRQLRPMVVLMDLLLPDIEGSEVIKQVCDGSSDTAFIVLTTLVGDEEIYRAIEAGARGYLFKDMARKELVLAIRPGGQPDRREPAPYRPDRAGNRGPASSCSGSPEQGNRPSPRDFGSHYKRSRQTYPRKVACFRSDTGGYHRAAARNHQTMIPAGAVR